eukprot:6211980-Pleurochrysis_carterae.AAC.5
MATIVPAAKSKSSTAVTFGSGARSGGRWPRFAARSRRTSGDDAPRASSPLAADSGALQTRDKTKFLGESTEDHAHVFGHKSRSLNARGQSALLQQIPCVETTLSRKCLHVKNARARFGSSAWAAETRVQTFGPFSTSDLRTQLALHDLGRAHAQAHAAHRQ